MPPAMRSAVSLTPTELVSEESVARTMPTWPRSGSVSQNDSARFSVVDGVSRPSIWASSSLTGAAARFGWKGMARRTIGTSLLLFTVFMWTLSNFLASYIFSDHTYSKPFFVVYVNTSMFAFSLIPMLLRYMSKNGISAVRMRALEVWRGCRHGATASKSQEDAEEESGERLLLDEDGSLESGNGSRKDEKLGLQDTAWLSAEFCGLWFLANYFASACLEYTSVGSVTILTSMSSIWTLVFCALMRIESFTIRKLTGVLASLTGVILISSIDLSGSSDESRGTFPHKSRAQVAIGDAMAFISAIVYGVYVTVMKIKVGNENRVDMPVFFGFVGLINILLLWPGFILLHYSGIETFELPPTPKVWAIILLNSVSSFASDMSWAYAMLLTTPLVVTVGLSLTIPLSLIGEMIQYEQYSSWIYWVGAGVVLLSFVFISHESRDDDDKDA